MPYTPDPTMKEANDSLSPYIDRMDTYLGTTLPADLATINTGRGATYTIAAYDASATEKAQADEVIDVSSTDDVERIRLAAIAVSDAGGGEVRLSAGTFRGGSLASLAANGKKYTFDTLSNVIIRGAGKATKIDFSTHRIAAPTGEVIFYIHYCTGIEFRDLYFVGDQSDNTAENEANKTPGMIYFHHSNNCTVQDCYALDGLGLVSVTDGKVFTFRNLDIRNVEQWAILDVDAYDITVDNIKHYKYARTVDEGGGVGYIQTAIKVRGKRINISNHFARGVVRETFRLEDGAEHINFTNIVTDNTGEAAQQLGTFHFIRATKINISNYHGIECGRDFGFTASSGTGTAGEVSDVTVSNFTIEGQRYGIRFFSDAVGGENISFSNGNIRYGDIAGSNGIEIDTDAFSNVRVTDVSFRPMTGATQGTGMYIPSGTTARGFTFRGCTFEGPEWDILLSTFEGSMIDCRFVNNDVVQAFSNLAAWNPRVFRGNWGGSYTSPTYYPDSLNHMLSNARSYSFIEDEFSSGATEDGEVGQLGWSYGGTGGTVSVGSTATGRPGGFVHGTGTTAGTIAYQRLAATSAGTLLVQEYFHERWSIKLSQTDTDTAARFGLGADGTANPPTNGIYFEKLYADTNWFFVTRAAGVQTRTDTGIAASTSYVWAEIRRINATTVGGKFGTATEIIHTDNIPANGSWLNSFKQIINQTTTAKEWTIDYFSRLIRGISR